MTRKSKELSLMQFERRLKSISKALELSRVKPGWIHFMRNALGMTLAQLGKRAGISISTAAQSERRESAGAVTIETLKKMASAMDCDFVYAFVPKKNIGSLLREKALEKAKKILDDADTHMTLEDQRVDGNYSERLQRLAEKLLEKGSVW